MHAAQAGFPCEGEQAEEEVETELQQEPESSGAQANPPSLIAGSTLPTHTVDPVAVRQLTCSAVPCRTCAARRTRAHTGSVQQVARLSRPGGEPAAIKQYSCASHVKPAFASPCNDCPGMLVCIGVTAQAVCHRLCHGVAAARCLLILPAWRTQQYYQRNNTLSTMQGITNKRGRLAHAGGA